MIAKLRGKLLIALLKALNLMLRPVVPVLFKLSGLTREEVEEQIKEMKRTGEFDRLIRQSRENEIKRTMEKIKRRMEKRGG